MMPEIFRSRRAAVGEQVSVYSFGFLLIIIFAGIVAGVTIFFNASYDFKQAEADILNSKIRECVSNNDLDAAFADNLFSICGLNGDVMKKNDIILKICKGNDYDRSRCIEDKNAFVTVGSNFVACGLNVQSNKNYPRCTESELTIGGEKLIILTGSNQEIRRVTG